MRTLLGFTIACVAVLALFAFQLARQSAAPAPAQAPQPQVQQQPAQPADNSQAGATQPIVDPPAATTVDANPATPVVPAVESIESADDEAPPPQSPPTIVWADDTRTASPSASLTTQIDSLTLKPADEPRWLKALRAAREQSLHDAELRCLAALTELHPNDNARRFELAVALMQHERYIDAKPHLQRLSRETPDRPPVWYNLAVAHQALGELSDAESCWTRAIELMPENPDTYEHRGEVRLDTHDWTGAASDFERVVEAEPEVFDALLNLSLARRESGALYAALDAARRAVELQPDSIAALNRVAKIARKIHTSRPSGDSAALQLSIESALRSLELDPDQPEIRALLGNDETIPQP